jgi:hypothetical protein
MNVRGLQNPQKSQIFGRLKMHNIFNIYDFAVQEIENFLQHVKIFDFYGYETSFANTENSMNFRGDKNEKMS